MELSSTALTGAMRIGIQVISSHKRPVLEIYHRVRNIIGPEEEFQNHFNKHKSRPQNIFIEFFLVNIGGSRAENVKLSMNGSLKRNSPRESFGDLFDVIIPQMPPGQTRYLFNFDCFDLNIYSKNGEKPIGFKDESFTITIEYDSGKGLLNWLFSLYSRFKDKRRFCSEYTFFPQLVTGDLPPAEYL